MLKKFAMWLYLLGMLAFLYGILMENVMFKIIGLSISIVCAIPYLFSVTEKIKKIKKEFEVFNPASGELRMRQIPESALNPKIAKLYVTNGQLVRKNDLLLEVETNKVILEVVSPTNAKIKSINKTLGQEVESGEVLINFEV